MPGWFSAPVQGPSATNVCTNDTPPPPPPLCRLLMDREDGAQNWSPSFHLWAAAAPPHFRALSDSRRLFGFNEFFATVRIYLLPSAVECPLCFLRIIIHSRLSTLRASLLEL